MITDRFKFRIYDEYTNLMHYDNFCILSNGDAKAEILMCVSNVMQCTGIKDSTGKLIYEGDIVEVQYFGGQIPLFANEYCSQPKNEVFEIAYSEEWHQFIAKNDNYKKVCDVHSLDLTKIQINTENKFYKVIGNIYETPELLEIEECES